MTWMIPFDAITSVATTVATRPFSSVRRTLPPSSEAVSVPPSTVFSATDPPFALIFFTRSAAVTLPGTTW